MIAGFLIDLHRCTGCSACVLACRLEHGWPASAPWRRVIPVNEVRYAAGPTYFLSVACHHCEEPACVKACPSGAYTQQADGVVAHDEGRCIGCRYCEMACPFGAPRFDEARGLMTKCGFCRQRIDAGERPACISACPTGALQGLGQAAQPDGPGAGQSNLAAAIPGVGDPAGCRPRLRFRKPRGTRGRRLDEFLGRRPW